MGYKEISYKKKKSTDYRCNKYRQRENNNKYNLIKDYKYGYYGGCRWKSYKAGPECSYKWSYYSKYI